MAVAVTIVAAMIEIITSYPHREPPSRRVAKEGRMKEKENADVDRRSHRPRSKRSCGIDNDINGDTITVVSTCTNSLYTIFIRTTVRCGTIVSVVT